MTDMVITNKEKAILVGVNINGQKYFKESMEELNNLAEACDIEIVGEIIQNLKEISRVNYIGSGKVEEVKELLEEKEVETVIFNNELSTSQLRNLEKELKCRILDRTTLILDIFERRAKTKEAKLQVQIAQLQYILPRLAGSYEALGRQSGGIGTKNKGSGEKKIELDKRKIEDKIVALNKELAGIVNERHTQRKQRNKKGLPSVALVGYTNAGKSTIMNSMVEIYKKSEEKKVFEKDMLFATLETSVRNITLPNQKSFILSDTVGFVSDLPHNLIKAFRSTLEEVREADLLCHIVDYSNPNYQQQIDVTNDTLKKVGASEIPMIYIYNKSDLTEKSIPAVEEEKIFISAKRKVGIEELIQAISNKIFHDYIECKMLIPYNQGDIVAYLNDHGNVLETSYENDGTLLALECKENDYNKYKQFLCN